MKKKEATDEVGKATFITLRPLSSKRSGIFLVVVVLSFSV